MDWSIYAVGLVPGESRYVPNEMTEETCEPRCITGVVGLCLQCETIWMMCGCGTLNFDCDCGHKMEFTDDYPRKRMVSLEVAIADHRRAKGDEADDIDEALYKIFDEDPS